MKTPLHRCLLRTVLGLGATIACALPAQTTAPTAPSGGTPGRTTAAPQSGTGANTTTRPAGQPTTPARTGALPNQGARPNPPTFNQPAQPTPGQPKQPTPAQPATTTTQPQQQNPALAPATTNQTQTGTVQRGATQPGTTTTTQPDATTQTQPGASPNVTGTTRTTGRAGTSLPAGATTLQDGTITSSGTIGTFDSNAFTLQTDASGTVAASNFLIGADTLFVDAAGNPVSRDRIFRTGNRAPVSVFYTQANDGSLMASKVVVNEQIVSDPIVSAGTITEVSPGILVIEQPGASDTPVRYVNNKTTNYVNENGDPVPPESVKAGTPVRIFYTKIGDTLVASKVEVTSGGKSSLPAPPIENGKGTVPAKSRD